MRHPIHKKPVTSVQILNERDMRIRRADGEVEVCRFPFVNHGNVFWEARDVMRSWGILDTDLRSNPNADRTWGQS